MEKHWNIKAPCSQNWDHMNATEQGRYCGNCCKTVVDFSNWEPGAILEYLNAHSPTCGRFQPTQFLLMENYPEEQIILQLSRSRLSLLQKIAVLLLFCFVLSAGPEAFAQQQVRPSQRSASGQPVHTPVNPATHKKNKFDQKPAVIPKKNPDGARSMIMGLVAPASREIQPKASPKEKPNARPNPKVARPAQ